MARWLGRITHLQRRGYDLPIVTDDAVYLFNESDDELYRINPPMARWFGRMTHLQGRYDPLIVTDDAVYLFDEILLMIY